MCLSMAFSGPLADDAKAEAKSETRSETKENLTVTDCLQEEEAAGEFSMIAPDCKTWDLHSS